MAGDVIYQRAVEMVGKTDVGDAPNGQGQETVYLTKNDDGTVYLVVTVRRANGQVEDLLEAEVSWDAARLIGKLMYEADARHP